MTQTGTPAGARTSRVRRAARRVLGGSAPSPAASRSAAPAIGPRGIPGRFLRVTHTPPDVEPAVEREVSDPSEAAAVRAGWLLIDAHERMSRAASERVFGHELRAWHAYADDTVSPLEYHLPRLDKTLVPETKNNKLRFRRMMDFARPGDRVFDVGFGRGLLAAQLVKDRGIESYHGLDIVDRYVPMANELFEVNGLPTSILHLLAGDLYDLTPEMVAEHDSNFVTCCEVLEHVPDAELALRTIADALPDGVEVLFSVPLHGRLEKAWGHLSVFDVARLKGMLDGAGLYAHHVEPLANTWALVVASRSPEPSERVRAAGQRPPVRVSVPLSAHRSFVDIEATEMTAVGGSRSVVTKRNAHKVDCTVQSGGGVTFAVDGLESLRIMFQYENAKHISRVVVTAYAGSTSLVDWTWKPKPGEIGRGMHRYSMRPGEVGQEFVSGPHKDVISADRVEVVVELPEGDPATFGFKAAYLP